ncbi:glycosyltransferase family 8 protein [Sporobolomyces koalae]|uniref:glycosyltransferase family 8 protein n=1 Tax=Sporobolomyces koalae TaxID=500713 RepID=UPI0031823071
MPPRFAYCTLLTSDSYLAGALTTVNSVLDVEPYVPHHERKFDVVCLVSPATVGHSSLKALEKVFDSVVGVEQIMTESWGNLDLLGRRDLAASLTKLHAFRLSQYDRIIFLDADTLVLRPLSHLFELSAPFSAAPDQGWPDAFNSGVMVFEPSRATFDGLIDMMKSRGTWDGGDQGLLNDYFPNWNRLSFTYNVTPSSYYTYAPAYKRHGQDVSVLHFIGKDKPWKRGTRGTYDPEAASKDYYDLVGQWFDVFERHFGSVLTYDVAARVMPPPASFKSTFTSLPSHSASAPSVPAVSVRPPSPPPSKPQPVPISPAVAAGRSSPPTIAWDPSRSSPPRDGLYQMRNPLPAGFNNVWDDPSASKRPARFQPPEQYPQPPKETHEWYKAVMQAKPDPTAVKPVFPWEEPKTPSQEPAPTGRKFGNSPPPAIETPQLAQPPMSFRSSSFTNAWDSIPGISKYADNLMKHTQGGHTKRSASGASTGSTTPKAGGRKSRSASTSSGSAGTSATSSNTTVSGGGRSKSGAPSSTSSYPIKGDASSRDGDDEDDEDADLSTTDQGEDEDHETDSDERDRIAIKFRRAESGGVSPTNTRNRGFDSSSSAERNNLPPLSPSKTRGNPLATKDSRFVPTSPRQTRAPSSNQTSHVAPPPVPHVLPISQPGQKTGGLNLSLPVRPQMPTTSSAGQLSPRLAGVTSPRLAAQAIRNSTAARLVSSGSGHGDAPPVVRATRVFSPETDTGVVKQQGLAALQRFVESMEAESNAAAASGAPAGQHSSRTATNGSGGAGTAGAWRH